MPTNPPLPLTGTQAGIWLAEQVSDRRDAFLIAHAVDFAGEIDAEALARAIRAGMSEADTVTARYREGPDGPGQILGAVDVAGLPVEIRDLRGCPDPAAEAEALIAADMEAGLRADEDRPLARHLIARLADRDGRPVWLWYQRYHHIQLDGLSFTVLARRIAALYDAGRAGAAPGPSPFEGTAPLLAEARAYEGSEAMARDAAFWRDACADVAPATLATRGRPEGAARRVVAVSRALPAETGAALRARAGGAPFDLMAAAVLAYLARMTGAARQSVGLPMMRRMGSAAAASSAPVVNVPPLSVTVDFDAPLDALAARIASETRALRRHARYDAERIQRDLGRVVGGQALYGPTLNYRMFDYDLALGGVPGRTRHLATGPVEDLEFGLRLDGAAITLELRADADLYEADRLAAHAARIETLLAGFLADPEIPVGRLPLMPEAERARVAAWSRGPETPASETATVAEALSRAIAAHAAAPALVAGAERLDYAEFGARVFRLARLLRAEGVGPGVAVGVALPRSAEAVVALFAVLAAGGVYVPLDPDYPEARLAGMCADARPRLILARAPEAARLPEGAPVLRLDGPGLAGRLAALSPAPFDGGARVGDPAYVIFTSGSTGRPKGVVVEHGALHALFLNLRAQIFAPLLARLGHVRAAHTHSFAFDSSWLQLCWLLMGQELHVIDEETRRDPAALVAATRALGLEAFDLTPSVCLRMLDWGFLDAHPALVLIGGEAAPPALWSALAARPGVEAWNCYGPTECTVDALRARIGESPSPVIGRPVGGLSVALLDARLEPVAPGAPGEIHLAGEGLARGYLGQPGMTAARFVAAPGGGRMYRTGDIARWSASGALEYLGRRDHQVKVRGYRVETGEIEAALADLPGVSQALVIAEAEGETIRLVAYALAEAEPRPEGARLRAALRDRLPAYMAPAAVVVLDAWPLTPAGKIDRARLPRPEAEVETRPETEAERRIAPHMARILGFPEIGAEADFFALGGDSIAAMTLCNALREEGFLLRPRDVFAGQTLRRVALSLAPLVAEGTGSTLVLPLATRNALRLRHGAAGEVLPLLPSQKGMLFHAETRPGGAGYAAFTRLELEGPLDAARLARALDAVLARHPHLGGAFDSAAAEEPLLVLPPAPGRWPFEIRAAATPAEAERIERTALARPLGGPGFGRMIGAVLIGLGAERHRLVLIVHHLLIDGWSTPLLITDLLAAYAADAPLPPLAPGYGEVVRGLLARDPAPVRATWRAALDGARPTRLFDGLTPSETVEEAEHALDATTSARLMAEARRRGVTLNTLARVVWAAVLGAMAGRDEVIFGTPVAGRDAPVAGIERQIGLFLSTIPVRQRLDPARPLWAQAREAQADAMALAEQGGIGLGEIQEIAGAGALFDTLLVVENYPDSAYLERAAAGLRVAHVHNRGHSHYPLALLVLPGDRIRLIVENRGAVPDAAGLAERVAAVFADLLAHPERPVAELSLAGANELAPVRAANATAHPLPALTLRDLLMAQAARTPAAPALIEGDLTLDFRETRRQALALAARLRALGVGRGDVVAVALPRSARLSLALLGVIEAGAAFLPLDLSYPEERLRFMVADAKPRAAITERALRGLFPAALPILDFDALVPEGEDVVDLIDPGLHPGDAAYLLYTSGTTGRPKGALVSHRAIVNRLLWTQHAYPLGEGDAILQKTPAGFDVSVWEFFWSYISGARLVMAPPGAHREPMELIDLIRRHAITTVHFVPSMLAIFLDALRETGARLPGLARVFASGEALPRALARDFADLLGAELHNLYGPTEAAIDVTHAPAMGAEAEGEGGVPIGRPVWNTRLHILDHLLREVPPGVAGELYLAGDQLGLGYLARPDLTATRFVASPFGEGERLYRTGDLARWRADGSVEYLGRTDHQVKIRGQRVELGEIEARILDLSGARQTVVVAQDGPSPRLVAYVVGGETEGMAAALGATLPAHMIPAAFVSLDALPLSPNGKLDRRALPAPPEAAAAQGRAPAEGLETRLAAIFAELTGRASVGAEEDFFALGGHSLLAMRLAARIRRDIGRHVTVGQVILMPTVAKLAEHLVAGEMVSGLARDGFDLVARLREGEGTPLVCLYPASGVSWQYSVLGRHLRRDMPIIGLQSPRPDGPIAASADMDELCDRQLAILREVQPKGPYHLLGYSLGGAIAHGLAVRLRAEGEEVRFLGLLDTYPPELHDWSDPNGAEADRGAEREQERLINDAMADMADEAFQAEKAAMFGHIFENYSDAVRLLSTARTPRYDGPATLFVAGRSVPPGIDPNRAWDGRAAACAVHRLAHCSHDDIISPASLEILGPLIDRLIAEAEAPALADA